tara:strand:+ start:1116 stop:1724 length:609 start_codon:yes stop_codon:yes gene_type:complete
MKNYYKALAGFQQECPVLLKQSDGFNYKYIDLPKIIHTINPLMKKHGLGFTQKLGTNKETQQPCLTTTIFHIESGESDTDTVDIPIVEIKSQNLYQSLGSGTTYFRRYALSSQLGIVSDKDIDAYGEQVKPVAKKNLDLGLPSQKKRVVAPSGDPLEDVLVIQKLMNANKRWSEIQGWLELTYDDITIEGLKNQAHEQETIK